MGRDSVPQDVLRKGADYHYSALGPRAQPLLFTAPLSVEAIRRSVNALFEHPKHHLRPQMRQARPAEALAIAPWRSVVRPPVGHRCDVQHGELEPRGVLLEGVQPDMLRLAELPKMMERAGGVGM